MENPQIGIIGLWHLGCVLSVSWAKLGHKVAGFDYDNDRVINLNAGTPPIFEPFLTESINDEFGKGMLSFSSDIITLSNCDFIFLSYDTPVNESDESDTSILKQSVNDVKSVMKDGAVLIVSSQSPVGYCSLLREDLKNQNTSLDLAYSPENLRLGEAIDCYLNPGRIILGTHSKETEAKCINLFNKITPDIIPMSLESSELVKHGINSFLATSIIFANNLADICEKNNGKIDDVVKGMKSDPRIGTKAYLTPGIGFSGGTLGRDLKVLNSANLRGKGYAKLFGEIHKLNGERKFAIVENIGEILGGFENKTIGILGLTYKPGTSTLRRSLPLEIVSLLTNKNVNIQVFDPQADYSELTERPAFKICRDISEVSNDSDILVLLTDWKEFKEFNWGSVISGMHNANFYDTRNFLDPNTMTSSGFKYYSIGK